MLHVVGGMDVGGIETWLMYLLRRADRRVVAMDFLGKAKREGAYDAEIRALGASVYPMPTPSRGAAWRRAFARLLRERGPYDVVHVHRRHVRDPLLVARRAGVRVRAIHSHNAAPLELRARSTLGRWTPRLHRLLSQHHATLRLACSERAAEAVYGEGWRRDPSVHILPYGIDLAPFAEDVDPAAVRAGLGLPADAFVVGNVARLHAQKNHAFLLEVFAEVARREPAARLVLVGDGELRDAIRARIAELGLGDRCLLTGVRSDVPRLLRAFDVFAFPSRWEGLGLVGVEAQAAGVPLVRSTAVPPEIDVVDELVTTLPLEAGPGVWADAILARREKPPLPPGAALAAVRRSPFDLDRALELLTELYRSQLERA